jgi:hypothetical protein
MSVLFVVSLRCAEPSRPVPNEFCGWKRPHPLRTPDNLCVLSVRGQYIARWRHTLRSQPRCGKAKPRYWSTRGGCVIFLDVVRSENRRPADSSGPWSYDSLAHDAEGLGLLSHMVCPKKNIRTRTNFSSGHWTQLGPLLNNVFS